MRRRSVRQRAWKGAVDIPTGFATANVRLAVCLATFGERDTDGHRPADHEHLAVFDESRYDDRPQRTLETVSFHIGPGWDFDEVRRPRGVCLGGVAASIGRPANCSATV